MKAPNTMVGRGLALVLTLGCMGSWMGCKGSDGKVPEPQEPDEPYTNPLLEVEPPPETSMENQAGLIIESSPAGMEVRVDGKSVGKTPITVEKLSEGEHEVVYVDPDDGEVTYTVGLSQAEFKKVHHASSPDASDARLGQ